MSPKTTFQASAGTFTGILPYFGKHYWLTLSDRPSIPHRCQRAKYIMPALHLLLKNIHNLKTLVPPSQAFLCHGSFKGSAQTPRFSDCREWTSGTHKRFSVSFFFLWKKNSHKKRNRMKDPYWQFLPRDSSVRLIYIAAWDIGNFWVCVMPAK